MSVPIPAVEPSTRLPAALRLTLDRLAGWRIALESGLLAALVFLPYLGSVGLWDPWESQYAEVAREMLQRGDLLHPHWEAAWFFSKPALSMWLMVPGLWATGGASTDGPLSLYTEWAVRLPFALFAIAAVMVLADTVARCASPRAGRLTGVALATMPMFFFVARQAMTDMAYVAPVTVAIAAGARATLVEEGAGRRRWWLIAFACAGVATLGKGMLGFGLPGVVLGLWAVAAQPLAPGEPPGWRARARGVGGFLRTVPWLWGLATFAVIAVPWYAAMFHFDGRDAEGKTFFERFILHDHFARLGAGVHTDSPGGSFTFYLEQLGFGLFPWVALVPGALAAALSARWSRRSPRDRLLALALCWALVAFGLFSASATRFHHYVLPAVPAIAVLLALTADDPRGRRLPALLCGALLLALVAKDLVTHPKHLADLFTYNHERPYPDFLWAEPAWAGAGVSLGMTFTVAVALGCAGCFGSLLWRQRLRLADAVTPFAFALALWLSASHWVALSHHWTQRDLFWRYQRLRAPGEPIAAFWMDWKGETFYSRNQVVQVKPGHERLAWELAQRPGRAWFLVEHNRLGALQQSLPGQRLELIEPQLNDKFVLVVASDG